METKVEDGFHLAVPNNVYVLLRLLLSRWIDALCMHTAHSG